MAEVHLLSGLHAHPHAFSSYSASTTLFAHIEGRLCHFLLGRQGLACILVDIRMHRIIGINAIACSQVRPRSKDGRGTDEADIKRLNLDVYVISCVYLPVRLGMSLTFLLAPFLTLTST